MGTFYRVFFTGFLDRRDFDDIFLVENIFFLKQLFFVRLQPHFQLLELCCLLQIDGNNKKTR